MEIDFLGLNSLKYGNDHRRSDSESRDSGNGEVETSLSLSTSCSTNCHRESFSGSSQKKKSKGLAYYSHGKPPRAEQPGVVLLARPVFVPSSTAGAGFLYDLNNSPAGLRSVVSKLPSEAPASLTTMYSGCSNVYNLSSPEQADKSGNVLAAEVPTRDYTPTVAMARRATLARFLEKRLHRINQKKEAPSAAAISGRSKKKRSNLISL